MENFFSGSAKKSWLGILNPAYQYNIFVIQGKAYGQILADIELANMPLLSTLRNVVYCEVKYFFKFLRFYYSHFDFSGCTFLL